MTDAELGAAVRAALASDGALATLSLRRGHDGGADGYTVQLHVYAEHADPKRQDVGNVRDGHHATGKGPTLDEALAALWLKLLKSEGPGPQAPHP